MKNQVIVVKDFDGYFEAEAKRIAEELPQEGITIKVSAGPYRSYDVDYSISNDGKTIELDYYSAVRAHFGSLHHDEIVQELKEALC